MNFASDNSCAAHPAVMEALARANSGALPSYGGDGLTGRVRDGLREMFEAPEAEVHLVATGTAANALALASMVRPWQAILCTWDAHIAVDECGAPEFYTGGSKLVPVPDDHGRMIPAELSRVLSENFQLPVHTVDPGALAITQVTEAGTVYPLGQIAELSAIARQAGMGVHMDGARFANALVALGATPAEMTWRAGVDALSLGGTKNGAMAVEAVIVFDPARADHFEQRRKRAGHLFSKHRFLAAQMLAMLEGDLWRDTATAANTMAARLAAGIAALPHGAIVHPVEANMVFVSLPREVHRRAVAGGASYYMTEDMLAGGDPADPITARLVTSWDTTAEEVDAFLTLIG